MRQCQNAKDDVLPVSYQNSEDKNNTKLKKARMHIPRPKARCSHLYLLSHLLSVKLFPRRRPAASISQS